LNKAFELAAAQVPTPIGVADGGMGASSVAGAQQNLQVLGRLEGWVKFNDAGTGVVLGTLPADSFVRDVIIQVTTLFNAGTNDLLSVGWDADVDALSVDKDVSATGIFSRERGSLTAGANDGYNATSRSIEAYYTYTGAAPTTGKALVIVEYWQVTKQP
jgi:hypothetical protein